MERRNFVIGLGTLAAGGTAALGTGAFSSVEANRDISVKVADDSDAFLGIEPSDTVNADKYVEETDGTVEIDIDESGNGGNGLNFNAQTTFDGLFKITNQGTETVQPNMAVEVVEYDGELEPSDIEDSIVFYAKDVTLTGIGPTDREDLTGEGADPGRGGVTFNLGVGDEVEIGLEIDFTDEKGAKITGDNFDSDRIEMIATIFADV